ncbi:MAG: DUF1987 domain-containing protein [Bacteroidales bacterium]
MKVLKIPSTDKSPRVLFDPENRIFEIEGNSRPENVREFYQPIIETLKKFFTQILDDDTIDDYSDSPLKFIYKLDYFNSSSAKFISDIFFLVGNYSKKGIPVKIYWYFDEGDEDMMEVGEDFSNMIDVPFQMIMISQ